MQAGANAGNGLQTWTLTAVTPPTFPAQAPFVPYFSNATYTVNNNGRAACTNGLNTSTCATANVFMAAGSSAPYPPLLRPTSDTTSADCS